MKKISILYLLIILIVSILPIIWIIPLNLKFDIIKFTEEWYKGVFGLFQLFVAFWFFTFLIKNLQEKSYIISLSKDTLQIRKLSDSILKFIHEELYSTANYDGFISQLDEIKYNLKNYKKKYKLNNHTKKFIMLFDFNANIEASINYIINISSKGTEAMKLSDEKLNMAIKNLEEYLYVINKIDL